MRGKKAKGTAHLHPPKLVGSQAVWPHTERRDLSADQRAGVTPPILVMAEPTLPLQPPGLGAVKPV